VDRSRWSASHLVDFANLLGVELLIIDGSINQRDFRRPDLLEPGALPPLPRGSEASSRVHHELDLVTTPAGDLVAMVHCNNGASELNSWSVCSRKFAGVLGVAADNSAIFETLFTSALDGAPDCGGLMSCNYLSGEPITGFEEGRPLFLRSPDSVSTWPPSCAHICSHP
jgi:hypothetical protein